MSISPLSAASLLPAAGARTERAAPSGRNSAAQGLSDEQQRELEALQKTDRKVRAHEAAHLGAAGGLANGGASYSMTRGPDGRYYATGGEVSISLGEGRTPQETLARAQQIMRAALAPADPSPQDYRVAAQAARMEAEAQRTLALAGSGAPEDGGHSAGGAPLSAYAEPVRAGALIDVRT